MHKRSGHALGLDSRHVTCNALASCTARLVMSVFLEAGRPWTVRRRGPMAIQANLVRGPSQLSIVRGAMHVMAGETSNSAVIHHTLREIIALHAVLVCRAIGKVEKAGLPERTVLQLPEVGQL